MDRKAWLEEQRRATLADFYTGAPTYDDEDIEITPTHRRFVTALLDRTPSTGRVLDAACGTGKYFGMILDAGRDVVGVDQSAGMLAQATSRYPEARTEQVGLQELAFEHGFDGVICVDAMENVFPEDWPLVVGNLTRALRPEGSLYFTVETMDTEKVEAAFVEATAQGLPVVPGEYLAGGYYHYYPPIPQVRRLVEEAGLRIVDEDDSAGQGYGYHHVLAQVISIDA
jgi:SAM-dependent methyltransferase